MPLCLRLSLCFEEVAFFAVQVHVNARDLRVPIHPQTNERLADLENDLVSIIPLSP